MSNQPLLVEVDTGSLSTIRRPPDQIWMVRLRRADHCVIVAIGLHRAAAEHLAAHIANIMQPTQPPPTQTPQPKQPARSA